jgi:phospholipid-transporting ATPase
MEFKECTIYGTAYAEVVDTNRQSKLEGQEDTHYDFKTMLKRMNDDNETARYLREFFTLLAVCHTVIPEKNSETGEVTYQAASPDEGALVEGAAKLGFEFVTRRPRTINVNILGKNLEYEILNICEFNSTRKRMSTVVRTPEGKIRLYCKGADTVIMERLAKSGNEIVEKTLGHLEEYACEGLRTLCMAYRDIPEDEYSSWNQQFQAAATTIVNRQDELDRVAEYLEKDLILIGSSAIEDKLQEGVPETIFTLAQAGIKIWVLTGDRQETAINIGYSCKLIQENMSVVIVNEDTLVATKQLMQTRLDALESGKGKESGVEQVVLVIDGATLKHALSKECEKIFFDLATQCKAVICCRVSPLQKALVVKLVKRYSESILLAIGDGANDVSMIQAAHVGVGINGMEGLQAARSSDFAISQFRFLKKLLLVHGAWSYQRLCKLILYSFYKNIALYMTQFWYTFYNGFSGQTVYESWTNTMYNVIFTVLPPLIIGFFDQHLSARLLDRYPEMYKIGQKKLLVRISIFIVV